MTRLVTDSAGEGGVADGRPGPRRADCCVRRRARRSPARAHVVKFRLADDEYELVNVAAARAGLSPSGYVARVGVDVARGQVRPLPVTTGAIVRELVEARTQLRRYGTLLNQAVAKLNATGETSPGLHAAQQRCEVAVEALRGATLRLAREH